MTVPRKTRVVTVVLAAASAFAMISNGVGQESAGSPRKLALLIGVNKYRDPQIPTLSGCVNDVSNWEDVLTKKYGFAPADIQTLVDEKATKAAVKEAFAKHLVARATADTVVVIAISSHGTQVEDKNGDETTDGLDESFVLHDSSISDDDGAPSQLIDDEVNQLITDLNRKTKHVVLIADACFSGTISRAAGTSRLIPVSERVRERAARRVAANPAAADDQTEGLKPLQGGPRYVLISASRSTEGAHEKSFDGRTNGAMSWFLTAGLRKAGDDATYKDVYEKMRFEVTTAFPAQHPEIEGAEQETAVFGLKPLHTDPYLAVEKGSGNTLTLSGGQVHGIGVGSQFGLFPPGTRTSRGATPLATVEVKTVGLTTSQATLTGPDRPVPDGARAFPTTYVVPIHRTKLFIPTTPAVMAKIRQAVKGNPAVELIEAATGYDLTVFHDRARQALVLEAGSAEPITDPIPDSSEDAAGKMVEKIAAWAKWYNVRNLVNPSEALNVSFKLVRSDSAANTKASDNNLTRLVVGESFDLVLESHDDRTLYFNVLDLGSTGQISVAYPDVGGEATLPPRGIWKTSFKATLRKDVDYDRDTAKVVISTKPLDLHFVEQSAARGAGRGEKGVSSILGDLVGRAAYGGSTRSFAQNKDVADQWTTRELVFEVQPAVTAQEQSLIKTCYDDLSAQGVRWKKASPMRGVVDPVQLDPKIDGVTFRNSAGRASPLYMSCLFAGELARFARAAAGMGVTDVQHLGIYNYRCIGGGTPDGRACKVSQHAFGRAIDLTSFTTSSGTFVVKDDWTKRPPPTCNATGGTAKDKFLRDLACQAGRTAGFNVLLTPNYNAAHRDHFHADATPGSNFVRGGQTNAAGTDPAAADLGD